MLATVGYGDIMPHTVLETGITVLIMILGTGFYSYLLGDLATVFQKKITEIDAESVLTESNNRREQRLSII